MGKESEGEMILEYKEWHIFRCDTCGTTFRGIHGEIFDPLRDEMTDTCPACGCPSFEDEGAEEETESE